MILFLTFNVSRFLSSRETYAEHLSISKLGEDRPAVQLCPVSIVNLVGIYREQNLVQDFAIMD